MMLGVCDVIVLGGWEELGGSEQSVGKLLKHKNGKGYERHPKTAFSLKENEK